MYIYPTTSAFMRGPCRVIYFSFLPSVDRPSRPTATYKYVMADMSRGVRMCRNKSSLYLPFVYMLLRVAVVMSSVLVTA
jgi:hypothetical protein